MIEGQQYVKCPQCSDGKMQVHTETGEAICGACGHTTEPPLDIGPHEHEYALDGTDIPKCVQCLSPAPTKQREGDQALPKGGQKCVQDLVIAEMEESKRVGLERYGSVLMTFNGRRSIQDVAEEVRDLHVYLTQVKAESEATRETLIKVVDKAILAEYDVPATEPGVVTESTLIAKIAVDAIMGWVVGSFLMPSATDLDDPDPVSVILDLIHTASHAEATNLQLAEAIAKSLGLRK